MHGVQLVRRLFIRVPAAAAAAAAFFILIIILTGQCWRPRQLFVQARIQRQRSTLPRYVLRQRGVVVSGVRRVNEVNARRARLVPGWVTVFGRVYRLGM